MIDGQMEHNGNRWRAFTLIELLVVIAIIGILAAIAIPQFAAYKRSAADSGVQSAVRNLAVAMEAFYVANSTYVGAAYLTTNALVTTHGLRIVNDSAGAPVVVMPSPGTLTGACTALSATCWSARGTNATDGTGSFFDWDSGLGGAQW